MGNITLPVVVGAIIGMTQWIKEKLGISGRPAEIASFVVGFLFGGAYQVLTFPPVTSADWFGAVVSAVLLGLVPSGLYKFGGQMVDRARGDGVVVSSGTIVTPDKRLYSGVVDPLAIKKH